MEAKERTPVPRDYYEDKIKEAKEIAFKAGMKEVVERSNEDCPHIRGFLKRDCDTCWQAQVKDWGL